MTRALKTFYCRGALGTRVNPDIIGYVWTSEFDLNTLRVDREIFVFGKKKLRIQKYLNTCGRGLNIRLGGYLERGNYNILFQKKNDKFQRDKSSWNIDGAITLFKCFV